MDSATFDQLTARLTQRLSRRRCLALLGSLGIASTAMTEGGGREEAPPAKQAHPLCHQRGLFGRLSV